MDKNSESVKELVEYLEKNIKKGYKIESLKWALINQKKSKSEIDKAIKIVENRSVKQKEEPKKEIEIIKEEIKIDILPEKKSFWSRIFRKKS